MIAPHHLHVLRKIQARLGGGKATWVVTGSLGMALQGMDVQVHDIDLQTDTEGAYEIEQIFSGYVSVPVRYLQSESIRSHLGQLEIDGVKVEIIGAVQKRIDAQTWEEPVNVLEYRKWVEVEGMQIPVLSLEYEYDAYRKLDRLEQAQKIKDWLQSQTGS